MSANLHNSLGLFTNKQAIDIAMARMLQELADTVLVSDPEYLKQRQQLLRASDILCQFIATLPKKCQEELLHG